jgi:hypothetical protein
MQEVWPEDVEMTNRLEHAAHMVSGGFKHDGSIPHIPGKTLMQQLLTDS